MNDSWTQFSSILEEEGWSLDRVQYRIKFLLDGFDVRNKTVLDVGCGKGTFAIYLALAGAKQVMGIDPEGAGSSKGIKDIVSERIEKLGLTNCEFLPVGFGEHPFPDESFDLVISYNSINHLHEVTSDLREDPAAFNIYQKIFKELFRITAPEGMVIISDCSRTNLFSGLKRYGIPHPLPGMRMIEWEKHQFPSVWKQLLQEAGFGLISQSWHVSAPFRHIRWLMDNWLFNFCTFSHFTLRAKRPGTNK